MKLGKRLRKSTFDRLQLAVGQDASIIVPEAELSKSAGFPEQYLLDLGMTSSDLRRLETYGFARRGYLPLRTGKVCRWVLVVTEELANGQV